MQLILRPADEFGVRSIQLIDETQATACDAVITVPLIGIFDQFDTVVRDIAEQVFDTKKPPLMRLWAYDTNMRLEGEQMLAHNARVEWDYLTALATEERILMHAALVSQQLGMPLIILPK